MQLSQEIFNILKGANIKLKLFDPIGNKTLDPELSARFYAYDQDFLITIRDEDDKVELVVQAGASFNFDKNKDLLDSIKRAGHNAMAEYTIRKFDKTIEPKDFAHDVVKEDERTEKAMKDMQPTAVTGYYEITDFWKEHTQMWDKSVDEVMHMIYEWTWIEMTTATRDRDELAKRTLAIVVDALRNKKDDMTFDDMIAQLESKTEEIRRLKELSGITESPAQPDVAELVGDVHYLNNNYDRDERQNEMQADAAKLMMAAKSTGDKDIIAGAESVKYFCNHYDFDEVQDILNNKLQELNQLVGGNKLEVEVEENELNEYRSRRSDNYGRHNPDMDPKQYPANIEQYGPIMTRSGRVIYYNPSHGNYTDGDTGNVLTWDEWNEADMPNQGADIEGAAPVPEYGLSGMHPQLDKDKKQWSLEMWASDFESRYAGLTDEANTEHKTKLQNEHPDIYAKAVEMYPDFALEHGSHPFKRDESVEEGDKIELTEWVWLIPALATAVRIGVPALKLLLRGGKTAVKKITPVAVNTTKTIATKAVAPGSTVRGIALGAAGMWAWDKVEDVIEAIKEWGVDMEDDALGIFAQIIVKYGIPAAAVGAIVYGGSKLKDYMDGDEAKEKEDEVVHNAHGINGMTTTYSSNLSTEEVTESYAKATGSFKTSYIQLPESTRLIIRHSKGVNEEVRGSRSRNIKALFIENSAGERFSFPHKYLQGAKAMAKHVSMGGTPYDAIGESIITLCTEVAQCNQFVKHVRTNKLVNESNLNIVETVKTKLNELKNTIKGLQTVKGYNDYEVKSTAIVEETEKEVDETVDLTDKFMYNTFTKTANMDAVLETVARIIKERDSMTDLTKQYIMRLYDMIKNKEDFKLTIDANDPEHPDNEDPIKYSGGQGQMAKLSASLTYLAMNSKNDEAFNILSHLGSELYDLSQQHITMLAKIVVYLDRNSKVGSAKAVEQESIVESIMTGLRREIA